MSSAYVGRAGSNGMLDLGLVGNIGTTEAEAETSDREASSRASGMKGIYEASEFERCDTSGETQKRWVSGQSSV